MQSQSSTPIIIGKFGAPFGVKGWIKVQSFADPAENILIYQPWLLYQKKEWVTCCFEDAKIQDNGIIVKLPGYSDRDKIRIYTNLNIAIERSQLNDSDLQMGQYFWTDLQGLTIINTQGITLGTLSHLLDNGAHDIMVVNSEKMPDILIPYVEPDIVKSVDLANKVITVDWELDYLND